MEEAISGWWVQLVGIAVSAIGVVLAYYVRKFANWLIAKAEFNEYEKEATQRLLDGMALAQETLVREAKLASADGKLTKEEIKKAEAIALEYAKDCATGPVLDIIKSWSERRVSSMIKQLLAKLKGAKNVTATPTTNDPA